MAAPDNEYTVPFDYSRRAPWLRAGVLAINDGLVSIASLMVGTGAIREGHKVMAHIGFAGLLAGAFSMTIGEYVSVTSQLEIQLSQMNRENRNANDEENYNLPNPLQAATASFLAFQLGGIVPLLAGAFIANYKVRMGVLVATVTLALVVFGAVGAVLGGTPVAKSCRRVVVGGLMAMAITFGLTKLTSSRLGM